MFPYSAEMMIRATVHLILNLVLMAFVNPYEANGTLMCSMQPYSLLNTIQIPISLLLYALNPSPPK